MPLQFRKVYLSPERFESAGVFDVNGDGRPDIVSGEFWYEGPDFKRKHRLCTLEPVGDYFDDFSTIPLDVNGDGRMDFVTGGPFSACLFWRENPGESGVEWRTHLLAETGRIETTRAWDVDGDGEPEIVPNVPRGPLVVYKLVRDARGRGTGRFTTHVLKMRGRENDQRVPAVQSQRHGIPGPRPFRGPRHRHPPRLPRPRPGQPRPALVPVVRPAFPLFGKDKIATFESYFIADKATHHETKNPYFKLINEKDFCRRILRDFGVDETHGLIVNGHVPVKIEEGESPIKASGQAITIDGAFSEVYGDNGFTLVLDADRTYLAQHHHFESVADAITRGADIVPTIQDVAVFDPPRRVSDTQQGDTLRHEISALDTLLRAYRENVLPERLD